MEATRAGMIFSHYENRQKYQSWRRRMKIAANRDSEEQVGLTGEALEAQIMSFAAMHPEYVTFGGTP